MNRKLHNTILAFSVTGVMLFVGLVVADPALPKAEPATPAMLPVAAETPDDPADSVEHSPAARTQAIEAEIVRAATAGEAIAFGASLVALSVGEAALAAALDDLDADAIAHATAAERVAERKPAATKRKPSASRDLIAVPYFSFARGSRGSRS